MFSFAEEAKVKKTWQASEKSCAKIASKVTKLSTATDKKSVKQLKGANKKAAKCTKAGF